MYSIISIKVLLSDDIKYLWTEEPTREEINEEIQDINNSFLSNIKVKYKNKKIKICLNNEDENIISFCKKYNNYKSKKTRLYFYGISLKIDF